MESIKITIWLTHKCNMSCLYCYEKDKKNIGMSMRIAQDIYEYICKLLKVRKICRCYITFHGGEPLIEYKLIDFFINNFRMINEVDFIFSITTNGTIMNENVLQNLRYIDDINVSIDGNCSTQNSNRLMKNGEMSSYIVEKNIKELIINNVQFNARMTVQPNQIRNIEKNIRYLIHLGIKNIICSLEMWNYQWTEPEIEYYLGVFFDLKKECINNYNVNLYGMMDSTLSLKGECNGGINNITIGYNGLIYPCLVVFDKSEYCIGDIYTGIKQDWINNLNRYNSSLQTECINCAMSSKCAGRRCVFLKEISNTVFRNLCLIQAICNKYQ